MDKIDQSIIHVGIDLGTTNSEIATDLSGNVEVVKNARGDEYTPSVFGIGLSGNKIVGKTAYQKLFQQADPDDVANTKAEIKRLMGTQEKTHFERNNKDYLPEEISAEILKSLIEDVHRKYPEAETFAAVITVPAHFDSLQNEATKRAGELAGFDYVVLLQEPIAAAMAYGYRNDQNANWLVYDFGGGTFDVALISNQDGVLKVVEHDGDNYLGGKDIDSALINQVLVPEIEKRYSLSDFRADNPKYETLFARLKWIAENAKIELTITDSMTIELDGIGEDDKGEKIRFSFEYTRAQFNELIKPIIDKTIDVVKRVIERSKIPKRNIAKLIFVGGPTQIPYLRERIKQDLGIEIDTSVDPLTTVAMGACVFGLGSRVPSEIVEKHHETKGDVKEVKATLNYESMTSDEDEMITGSFELPDDQEYHVRINSESGYYNSDNIAVKNGKFVATLAIEPHKANKFWIYLIDDKGNNVPIFPDSFTITHGTTTQGAPIPHDIGVIYSRKSFDSDFEFVEECDRYFERGSIVPLEATKSYKTARLLEKDAENPLPIKVYEGDMDKPEQNEVITTLAIEGSEIPYNLPVGTDVDITIKIDESRTVEVEAYIPSIEKTLNARVDTYAQEIDSEELRERFEKQKKRAEEVRIPYDRKGAVAAEMESIEENLDNTNDADSQRKASRDLNKLTQELDDFENNSKIDVLAEEFQNLVHKVEESIDRLNSVSVSSAEKFREQLAQIKENGEGAVRSGDKIELARINEDLTNLMYSVEQENPVSWVAMFQFLEEIGAGAFTNPSSARSYMQQANRAINMGDVGALKDAVRSLISLLSADVRKNMSNNIAGITK